MKFDFRCKAKYCRRSQALIGSSLIIEPQVDDNDYDGTIVDDDQTNDQREYYTDYEEETDEELEKEMPDATDVDNGDQETDEEVPDELVNDDGKPRVETKPRLCLS